MPVGGQVTLTSSIKNVAISTWFDAMSESAQCLVDLTENESFRMYDKNDLDASLTMQCSLVLCDQGACIVSWVKPYHDLCGRIVTLDDEHRIIFPSNFNKAISLQKSFMVIPSIGSRVRKQYREVVQPFVRRLMKMHNIAIEGSQLAGFGSTGEQCYACAFQAPTKQTLLDVDMRQCGFCLKTFHKDCCDQLMSHMNSFGQSTTIQPLSQKGVQCTNLPICLLSPSPTQFRATDTWLNDQTARCVNDQW